jgi:hypothetical protein
MLVKCGLKSMDFTTDKFGMLVKWGLKSMDFTTDSFRLVPSPKLTLKKCGNECTSSGEPLKRGSSYSGWYWLPSG